MTTDSARLPERRDERQRIVAAWIRRCFGPDAGISMAERVARIVEEVAELAQAEGVPPELCRRIIDHVYTRPAGNAIAEAGGACVTLLGYAAARGFSLHDAEAAEIKRLLRQPAEAMRAKQAIKAQAGISDLSIRPDLRLSKP